ncbi:type B DNA-directed DNA polymerase [Halobacterium wangiae]|uniref:type B DNA-directed DNA polymerase n=1 Tax=Halobacterium wangiae TaxID=2902623 RepID=UPI001E3D4453|nr:type B DNA-directed DNA polymerase [Halobacterium wangiae]
MVYKVDHPEPGTAVTWTLTKNGIERETHTYHPTLYVETNSEDLRSEVVSVFDGHPRVHHLEVVTRRPGWRQNPTEVLRVDAVRLDAVDELARTASQLGRPGAIRLYNVDLSREFRYCLETGTNPEPTRTPSVVRLTVPPTSYETGLEEATIGEDTITGTPREVAGEVGARVQAVDPDILQVSSSRVIPLLFDAAQENDYQLGREPGYQQLAGASTYESYGQVGHSPPRHNLPGRVIVDESNTFWLKEANVEGMLDLVRRSWKPLQETAWASIGNILTAIQIRYADNRGVLVPWRSWRHERFKTARTLDTADRGGYTFAPDVGVHEDVHELDFSSLYPNIIREHNLSPETVRCDCHPDRKDVPGLNYAVCPEDGYLPEVLGPIIDDRDDIKRQIRETDDPGEVEALEGASAALKWILVSCFGYQGFANAKFGRIECHEAINAYAREILLDAKQYFERHGWRVVHGIVDSVWVQAMPDREQTPIKEVAREITDETGIRLEHEAEYEWIAFCPRRNDDAGALTRYFGFEADSNPSNSEAYKHRGIEARQHSTPPYIKDVQKSFIQTYSRTRDPEAVCQEVQAEISRLQAQEVEASALAITNRVSKPLAEYSQSTRNVAALERATDVGLEKHAGENVEYVVVDNSKRGRDRVQLLAEDPKTYDGGFYVDELIRAAESVLAPMEYREEDIRAFLDDTRDATLGEYGS